MKLPANATRAEKEAAKITRIAAIAIARDAKDKEIVAVKTIKIAAKVAAKVAKKLAKEKEMKRLKKNDKIRKAKIDKEMVGRYIIENQFRRLDMFRRIKNRMEGLIGQYIAFNQLAMSMLLGKFI